MNVWDLVIAACGFGFAIALIPNLINKKTQIPIQSSLTTASLLSIMTLAFWNLELYVAFIGNIFTATVWWLLVAFRRIKKTTEA